MKRIIDFSWIRLFLLFILTWIGACFLKNRLTASQSGVLFLHSSDWQVNLVMALFLFFLLIFGAIAIVNYESISRLKINYSRSLLIALLIMIVGWLLANQYKIITYPYQLEYREGAILLTTEAFLNGINPYSLSNFPIYINVYGFVYNLFILPLAAAFGNTLFLHRLTSFIFIIAQMGLILVLLRKLKAGWVLSLLLVQFVWVAQVFFTTSLTRPDTLGEFFFLASLILPFLLNFNFKGILLGLFLSILGFYTKPYFIIGAPILILYVFLFISKSKAIYSGILFTLVFIPSVLIINQIAECYFLEIIFSHTVGYRGKLSFLIAQTQQFIREFWVIILGCGIIFFSAFGQLVRTTPRRFPTIDLKSFSKPFFSKKMGYFPFILLLTGLLVGLYLGKHTGTHMVYFYQFILPFLLILLAISNQRLRQHAEILAILLAMNLLTYSNGILNGEVYAFKTDPDWQVLERSVAEKKSVLNSPVSVSLLISEGIPIVDSGQTGYAYSPKIQTFFTPGLDEIKHSRQDHNNSIKSMIEKSSYDLIMVDPYNESLRALVEANYQKIKSLEIPCNHTRQIWNTDLYIPKQDLLDP